MQIICALIILSIDAQKIEEVLWNDFPDLKLDLFP